MLKIEEKEYDLNFLFQFSFDFQMLKEILIKLAKSNQDLETRVKNLEKSNKEKDNRISNLEDKMNIDYIPEEKSNLSSGENDEDLNDISEDGQNKNEEKENDENNKNEDNENNYEIDNDNKKNEIKKSLFEPKKEGDLQNEQNKDKNQDKNDSSNFIKEFKRQKSHSIKITKRDYANIEKFLTKPQVTHDAIKSLMKLIRENTDRIKTVDRNLNNKLVNSFGKLKKEISNLDSKNDEDHKIMNEKIADLSRRLYDCNDKMDGVIVKTAGLDTLSMFKDSGNGTVDAAKTMVKILEEKINKKIEIIEKKTKKDENNEDDLNLQYKIDHLETMVNNLNKQIDLLKRSKGLNQNDLDDAMKELKSLIDKNNNDILTIIEELSKKLKDGQLAEDKMDELLKKLKSEKHEEVKHEPEKIVFKNDEKGNMEINKKLEDLKERIKELNKKINEKDIYFNNALKDQIQDINELKRKIEEMNSKLDKKITKDDLREINHTLAEHSDVIKYLEDKVSELNEGFLKLAENNSSFVNRLENMTHELLELKKVRVKGVDSKPVDLTKFVDENKLKEILKPYKKNIDILMQERDSLYNRVSDIEEKIKFLETKDRVNKLEEELNEKINDIFNKLRKYLEKSDFNKIIKNIEIQLKLLSDNQHNKDADSWILAKHPLGCFNCATCEANIKNMAPSNEYLPWNKYPIGERQYNIGQGFSRLLQRISNDSAYKNERKEFSSDNDINNNLYNSMTNINGNFVFKINNKETMKEDFNENNYKPSRKYKLPNVFNNKKKKIINMENIPLTDEEHERENVSFDNSNSPKIMRITKKKIDDLSRQIVVNSQQKSAIIDQNNSNSSKGRMNSTTLKHNSKLERVRSMPFYDNV